MECYLGFKIKEPLKDIKCLTCINKKCLQVESETSKSKKIKKEDAFMDFVESRKKLIIDSYMKCATYLGQRITGMEYFTKEEANQYLKEWNKQMQEKIKEMGEKTEDFIL